MRLVMVVLYSDEFTYNCTHSYPIEYESAEAAIVEWERLNNEAEWSKSTFTFAGVEFWKMDDSPEFYTIDEWFGEN